MSSVVAGLSRGISHVWGEGERKRVSNQYECINASSHFKMICFESVLFQLKVIFFNLNMHVLCDKTDKKEEGRNDKKETCVQKRLSFPPEIYLTLSQRIISLFFASRKAISVAIDHSNGTCPGFEWNMFLPCPYCGAWPRTKLRPTNPTPAAA